MAKKTIEVVINVRDQASKKTDKVGRSTKDLGKKVKETSADFSKFNKTLFATTAFIGTFVGVFSKLNQVLFTGSNYDRLALQFERVLGPHGRMMDSIRSLTSSSIDEMEAMRSGIKLRNLGIARNMNQVADIISKAGVAAKIAGLDSSEGIKSFTRFMQDGSVANLEFLNLIARTNPALQAQLAILSKSGGVMGTVLTTQQKLAIGMKLLNAATKNQMMSSRDLRDTMLDLKQNVSLFGAELGRFIGKSLQSFIDKMNKAFLSGRAFVDNIRTGEKSLVFFTKNLLITSGVILAVAGAVGTLRLGVLALGALGFTSLMPFVLAVTTLATVFTNVEESLSSVMNRLKIFGKFFTGITQLVSSFFLGSRDGVRNFDAGISVMNSSLASFLRQYNIFGEKIKEGETSMLDFALGISKVIIMATTFVQDVGRQLISWATDFYDWINKLTEGIAENFGLSDTWTRDLIEGLGGVRGMLVKVTAAFVALKAAGFLGLGSIFATAGGAAVSGLGLLGGAGALLKGLGLGTMIKTIAGGLTAALTAGASLFVQFITLAAPGIGLAIAAALGMAMGKYVINPLLDMMTTGTNKDTGYSGNIIERGLDKLNSLTGGIITGSQTLENQKKAAKLKQQGFSITSTRMLQPNNEDIVEKLQTQSSNLNSKQQERFGQMLVNARNPMSQGGSSITAEEVQMLVSAFKTALDESEAIKELGNNTRKTADNVGGPLEL